MAAEHTDSGPGDGSLRLLDGLVKACSLFSAALGALALAGWWTGTRYLGHPGSHTTLMSPLVAVGLIFLAGVCLLYRRASRNMVRAFALLPLFFLALVSLSNVVRFAAGFHWGIEETLVRGLLVNPALYGAVPISPIVAALFLFDCLALTLLIVAPGNNRSAMLAVLVADAVLSFNLVVLLGYLYGTPFLYGGKIRPVALPVALAFIALNTGIIASVRPARFPLSLLVGPSVRATLLRTFFLVISLVAGVNGIGYRLFADLQFNAATLAALSTLSYLVIGSLLMAQIARAVGSATDRAEQRRRIAEEELRRNRDHLEDVVKERTAELVRSNAELEHFAHVASHDLKEPVLAVASNLKLVERRIRDKAGEEVGKFLANSLAATFRMEALIDDLLSYSRIGTQGRPFEAVDVAAVLGNVLADLTTSLEETGAQVTFDALPTVTGDPVQIGQLLMNLISNAVKFSKGTPHVHISASHGQGEWIFSVRDNGIGIPKAHAETIFEIFRRVHGNTYPGTGVGLATCKKIVERHGGRIWVESEPGQWSVFYFSIPESGPGEEGRLLDKAGS